MGCPRNAHRRPWRGAGGGDKKSDKAKSVVPELEGGALARFRAGRPCHNCANARAGMCSRLPQNRRDGVRVHCRGGSTAIPTPAAVRGGSGFHSTPLASCGKSGPLLNNPVTAPGRLHILSGRARQGAAD